MRRMRDANGDDDEAEPMEEGSGGREGTPARGPSSLAEANPPARMQLAAPAAPRQTLSVDIPKADSLPEHRIQVRPRCRPHVREGFMMSCAAGCGQASKLLSPCDLRGSQRLSVLLTFTGAKHGPPSPLPNAPWLATRDFWRPCARPGKGCEAAGQQKC